MPIIFQPQDRWVITRLSKSYALCLSQTGSKWSGHYTDADNASQFSGTIATGHGITLVQFLQTTPTSDYYAVHAGKLVRTHTIKGQWYDTAGNAGAFTLERDPNLTQAVDQARKRAIANRISSSDPITQVPPTTAGVIPANDANRNLYPAFDCPSSTPDLPNSKIFGIVEGTVHTPIVTYLERSHPITPELLAAADPAEPTEMFRVVGACLETGCQQFGNGQCQLAKRMVQGLPAVTQSLPACAIRHRCRWWHQEGEAACHRCPQIVRTNYAPSETLHQALKF
jgi:hypothetical protein